jgi:N-acetylmuramoyl-L-alanine amidase CwlA
MQINKLLTPYNLNRLGDTSRIKYIVIHYVGATGGAEANCRYYASEYIGASAHYYVGFDGEIWQSVEDGDIAWHCGAKSYRHSECRNSNSIGIELCVRNRGSQAADSRDWYFENATVRAAVELTRGLMEKYGISADRVIRHYDVTGKICPNPYVYNHTTHTWDGFKAALTASPETQWTYQPIGTGAAQVEVTASSLVVRDNPGGIDTGTRYHRGERVVPTEKAMHGSERWFRTEKGWISANYLQGWILESGRRWYLKPGYTYPAGHLEIIDGRCYCFDFNGWMMTPDRIREDGEVI